MGISLSILPQPPPPKAVTIPAGSSGEAIQTLLEAAPPGADILFANGVYAINKTLYINKGCQVLGAPGQVEIRQSTAGSQIFCISACGVTLSGLTLIGTGSSSIALSPMSIAIYASPAGSNSRISGLIVRQCTIRNWMQSAIYLEDVDTFHIVDNRISNITYSGITIQSGSYGIINGNCIDDIKCPSESSRNGYGISCTKRDPQNSNSSNIEIFNNLISNVAAWSGIDTHAGKNISIFGNTIWGCYYGVTATQGPSPALERDGSTQITVERNTIASAVMDGSKGNGIQFWGGSKVPTTGSIRNNTIIGMGNQAGTMESADQGGILIYGTGQVTISGNQISQCSPHGIVLRGGNAGTEILRNSIIDSWTNTPLSAGASGIFLAGCSSVGTEIDGNVIMHLSRSADSHLFTLTTVAPGLNGTAIRVERPHENSLIIGTNYSNATISSNGTMPGKPLARSPAM